MSRNMEHRWPEVLEVITTMFSKHTKVRCFPCAMVTKKKLNRQMPKVMRKEGYLSEKNYWNPEIIPSKKVALDIIHATQKYNKQRKEKLLAEDAKETGSTETAKAILDGLTAKVGVREKKEAPQPELPIKIKDGKLSYKAYMTKLDQIGRAIDRLQSRRQEIKSANKTWSKRAVERYG